MSSWSNMPKQFPIKITNIYICILIWVALPLKVDVTWGCMTQLLVIHNAIECAILISSIIHKETWQLCDNLVICHPKFCRCIVTKKGQYYYTIIIIVCAFCALAHKREDLGKEATSCGYGSRLLVTVRWSKISYALFHFISFCFISFILVFTSTPSTGHCWSAINQWRSRTMVGRAHVGPQVGDDDSVSCFAVCTHDYITNLQKLMQAGMRIHFYVA